MPKPRSIDPSFWDDLDVIALSRDERLLLTCIITAGADDQGLCKANAPYLKRLAFAFDADIGIEDVERMVEHIDANCRNVLFYETHGERYLGLRNWQKYQNIRYARKTSLPHPPWAVGDQIWPTSANFSKTVATLAKPLSCSVGLGSVEQGCSSVGGAEAPQNSDNGDDKLDSTQKPTDAEVGKVYAAWQQARGGLMNQLDSQKLGELIDLYSPHWVECAIHDANAARQGGLISLNYVAAFLARWQQDGFRAPRGDPVKRADEAARKHGLAESVRRSLQEQGHAVEDIERVIREQFGEGV